MKPKAFETERLTLTPVSTDDAELIFRLYNEPKFIEFIGDKNIRSVEDAERYIKEKFHPHIEQFGFGNYVIIRKTDGEKLGTVGVFGREGLDAHDIGFALLPEFEGGGCAFEAAQRIFDAAFSEFGLKKISAITTHGNFRSQKLIEKLGLKFVKTVRLPDDDEELRYYET
ncbi:GNAT family N-acetyltransferase [Kaistella pullorum]|uniref:GNAT family N-acetyltransferase n=1 Tax=Kaistella pullorum TaxID=2763074 RepID=A0ABR8WJL6_9FLAO|nr:GNAT family N-acetyltransferase [Kaistella pullorum]MBD8017254.1 GNAT family N-acetyltransferase [Kaistella pullorum]